MEKEPTQVLCLQAPLELPLPAQTELQAEISEKEEQVSTCIDEVENQQNLEILREKADVLLKLIEHPGWYKAASKVIIIFISTRLMSYFRKIEATSIYHIRCQMR